MILSYLSYFNHVHVFILLDSLNALQIDKLNDFDISVYSEDKNSFKIANL